MSTTEAPPDETVIHVLWINAGLSCDGDSVALTAATQPSIEEIALGALPGLAEDRRALAADRLRVRAGRRRRRLPRVVLQGRPRRARAVRARRRGLDPERGHQERGLLVRVRQQPRDRPADDHQRVARPAGAQGARRRSPSAPAPPTAASTPWPATRPAPWACPTTSAGAGSRRPASRSCACPGCPAHPDNMSETILYLLYQATGQAPMIPLDEALRPHVAVRRDRARGLRPGRLLRAGRLRHRVRLAEVHREARLLGPGREVQRAQAGLDQRRRRLPERRRHLHRLHDARLPRQVHAVHGRAAGRRGSRRWRAASTARRSAACGGSRSKTVDEEPKWREPGQASC